MDKVQRIRLAADSTAQVESSHFPSWNCPKRREIWIKLARPRGENYEIPVLREMKMKTKGIDNENVWV